MATLRLYPSAIRPGSGYDDFTDAQLTQILGNSSNTVGSSKLYQPGTGIYAGFYFDTSQVPSGAIINSITASTQAYADYNSTRAFYSVAAYHPTYGNMLKTQEQSLTYSPGTYSIPITSYTWPVDAIRNSAIEWDFCFITTWAYWTVALYLQKFFLDIDYTPGVPPSGGKNVLYLGENF